MFHEIITKSVLNFFVLFWDYWLKEFQANMCLPQIITYVQSARTKKTPQKMKELDYKVSLFPSSPSLSLPPCFHVYKTSHPCLCVYRGSNIISFSKLIYSSLVYSAFLRSLLVGQNGKPESLSGTISTAKFRGIKKKYCIQLWIQLVKKWRGPMKTTDNPQTSFQPLVSILSPAASLTKIADKEWSGAD